MKTALKEGAGVKFIILIFHAIARKLIKLFLLSLSMVVVVRDPDGDLYTTGVPQDSIGVIFGFLSFWGQLSQLDVVGPKCPVLHESVDLVPCMA